MKKELRLSSTSKSHVLEILEFAYFTFRVYCGHHLAITIKNGILLYDNIVTIMAGFKHVGAILRP